MAKYSIAKLGAERAGSAAELHCKVFRELKETKTGFEAFLRGNRFGLCAVNGRGGVDGYVVGTSGGAGAYLNWIAVGENARGNGLGRRLMRAFEKEAAGRGLKAVALDTRNIFRNAIKLFLDCDYDIFGCQLAGKGDLLIRMSKTL